MNQTIETILQHRSIRSFTNDHLSKNQIYTLIDAAQMASTSSYMQAYTIMGITDTAKKAELADITGQEYVQHNGHLFIFCADLHRHQVRANESQKEDMIQIIENTEHLLVSTIDATLAAQNAAIAAESMGLGMCYIGSIRNNIQRVDEILKLPQHVIPLFGMVVGYPESKPEQKPRIPRSGIYFENEYRTEQHDVLQQFDETIEDYYESRGNNTRKDSWTDQMIRRFSNPVRMDVTTHVQNKGLNKR